MLISFTVSNFGPFRDQTEFWMIPFPKLAQHKERLVPLRRYRSKVLSCAALFGPNASGKSAFVSALAFLRSLVLEGSRQPGRTGRIPFGLQKQSADKPTRFALSCLAGGTLYDYECELSDLAVSSESLRRILTKTEEIVFQRNAQTFTGKLFADETARNIAYSTGADTLLLKSLLAEGVAQAAPLGAWFRSLKFLSAEHSLLPKRVSAGQSALAEALDTLATGISGFQEQTAYLDGLPRQIREELIGLLYGAPGNAYEITLTDGSRLRARLEAGSHRIEVQKILPTHHCSDGAKVMEAEHESYGVKRLIRLLPQMSALISNPASGILIVDDLDLGLHPLLTKKILTDFLQARDGTHMTQLIFTTRSTELLDQNLFRRDELWFTERTEEGACQLRPLTSFVSESGKYIRFDKIIRRDYLKGLFGAVPKMGQNNIFAAAQSPKSSSSKSSS